MEQGGLQESAQLLMKLPVMKDKQIGPKELEDPNKAKGAKEGKRSDLGKIHKHVEILSNENDNANIARHDNRACEKINMSKSMETIYDAAVPRRESSSSDDELNVVSSDDSGPQDNAVQIGQGIEFLIADQRRKVESQQQCDVEEQPSTSYARDAHREDIGRGEPRRLIEDKVQDLVREAENAKARIFSTPGNVAFNTVPSALVDEGYIVVGAHLEEGMIAKIVKGEYVDFGKLLPKDRMIEEEGRMEMYVKNGRTYWAPASVSVNIGSFSKWEQAFRVFSNIYCKENPSRAAELIEYNHIIHTISQNFSWENVYSYDKDFRLHIARNPQRSWSMILQQAWSLRLRDRITHSFGGFPQFRRTKFHLLEGIMIGAKLVSLVGDLTGEGATLE